MKLRAFTNFLILIYGLSITAFGVMEMGHETLHEFKNSLHHHQADHHHVLEDHDVVVHDDNTNSIDSTLSSLAFSILFYEFCTITLPDVRAKLQYHSLKPAKTHPVVCRPFIPPPIMI